jgi:hypothetical protein
MSHILGIKEYSQLLPILGYHELKMVIARLNDDYFAEAYHRRVYLGILTLNGWTEERFEKEMLRRIDAGWDIKTPPPRGDHPMVKPAVPVGIGGL